MVLSFIKKYSKVFFGFLLFILVFVFGLLVINKFYSVEVKADEVRSGSYVGSLIYTDLGFTTVGFENSYKVDFLTPNSLGVGDNRIRTLGQVIDSSHIAYFGSRDAFYSFNVVSVSVYVSSFEQYNGVPRYNMLLLSKNETFDLITLWGNNINFYLNGGLVSSITKNDIKSWYSNNGVDGYLANKVYLRMVFDFDNTDYELGYNKGYEIGKTHGYDIGYDTGYGNGYQVGEADGYDLGINESLETGGFTMVLSSVFHAVGALLAIEILPNIYIGMFVAIPLVFGVIMFIIGKRKDD